MDQMGKLDVGMKACYLWTTGCGYPYSMVMAGKTLFVGGDGASGKIGTLAGDRIPSHASSLLALTARSSSNNFTLSDGASPQEPTAQNPAPVLY